MADPCSDDRRTGDRRPIPTLRAEWVVTERSRWRKTVEHRHPGVIVEVSAHGAAIVSPASVQLPVGTVATVTVGVLRSVVKVVHGEPAEDGTVRYGVQWVELDPRMRARIDEVLGRESSANVWESSR